MNLSRRKGAAAVGLAGLILVAPAVHAPRAAADAEEAVETGRPAQAGNPFVRWETWQPTRFRVDYPVVLRRDDRRLKLRRGWLFSP